MVKKRRVSRFNDIFFMIMILVKFMSYFKSREMYYMENRFI